MKNKEGYLDPTAGEAMKRVSRIKWLEEKHGIKVGQEFTLYFIEKMDKPDHKGKNHIVIKKRAKVVELYDLFAVLQYSKVGYRETFYYDRLKELTKPPKEGDTYAKRRR